MRKGVAEERRKIPEHSLPLLVFSSRMSLLHPAVSAYILGSS
jgi:hypothetical protein